MAVLSVDGKTLNEERHAREYSRYIHFPPNPLSSGTILDAANKRFVVRVCDPDINRHIEQWWVFDLENGKRIGTLEPGRSMTQGVSRSIMGAQAVGGTPLVLTHWWKFVFGGNCGGVFTLVDLNDATAKPVWSLSLDGVYAVPGNREAEDALRNRIWSESAILEMDKPHRFAIHAVKQQKRITYSVEKAGALRGKFARRQVLPTNSPRTIRSQKPPHSRRSSWKKWQLSVSAARGPVAQGRFAISRNLGSTPRGESVS